MAGSTNIPKFEIPQGFTVTVPGPIDDRTKISSVANLDTELPMGVRYLGMPLIWVDDEAKWYMFAGGIENDNFMSLTDFLQFGGGGEIISIAFTYDYPIPPGTTTTLTHNLNSVNLHVTIFDGRQPLLIDWSIPEFEGGSNTNQIEIHNDVPIENMRVVLAYAQTLSSNPSGFLPSDAVDTFTLKKRTIVSDTTQSIPANSKLLSIDYRQVSGTPIVKCGLTAGADDIHEEVSVLSGDDENIVVMKTYAAAQTLYFTVSGGAVDINININENVF
jgi:hypothetical protein